MISAFKFTNHFRGWGQPALYSKTWEREEKKEGRRGEWWGEGGREGREATEVCSCSTSHLGGWSRRMTWARNSGTAAASFKIILKGLLTVFFFFFSFCVCCYLCVGVVLVCILVCFLSYGLSPGWPVWLRRGNWPWVPEPPYLYLLSARITGVCFHTQLRDSLVILLSLATDSQPASPSNGSRCTACQTVLQVQISSL